VLGKISSISLNVQENVVITGSTFDPLHQVSSVALDSGKVLSNANPADQFSYVTAISTDASRTAIFGISNNQGVFCNLVVFNGTDLARTPAWQKGIQGYMWVFGVQRGMRMSPDGSLVGVAALKSYPQYFQPEPTDVYIFDRAGAMQASYSLPFAMGEVWVSQKYFAFREYVDSLGYIRIVTTTSPQSNCSVPATNIGVEVSGGLNTILQISVTSEGDSVVNQSSGGQQCADNWQYTISSDEKYVALATSDVASVLATSNNPTITFSLFLKSANAAPPKPSNWTVKLPPNFPDFIRDDVEFAFSTDGVHLAIGVAGVGIYYVNVKSGPSSLVQVYGSDNPCGFLSLAINPNSKGDVFVVAAINSIVSLTPEGLRCTLGGAGTNAFKIPK